MKTKVETLRKVTVTVTVHWKFYRSPHQRPEAQAATRPPVICFAHPLALQLHPSQDKVAARVEFENYRTLGCGFTP